MVKLIEYSEDLTFTSIDELRNSIFVGNIIDVAKKLPDNSINTIVTSPPYWNKRIYCDKQEIDGKVHAYPEKIIWDNNGCEHNWVEKTKKIHNGRGDAQKSAKFSEQKPVLDVLYHYWVCDKCNGYSGELGHEKDPYSYIEHLASVFDILYDKVTEDGSCWVNLGDSMFNGDQVNVPILFAERMKKKGWILKRARPWVKGNPMPSSDVNNYTMDYEFFLWFTKKRNKYYFQTQYKPYAESTLKEILKPYEGKGQKEYAENGVQNPSDVKRRIIESVQTNIKFGGKRADKYNSAVYSGNEWKPSSFGALERATIMLNTKGTRYKHYAAFTIELPKRCIVATCPKDICNICGHKRKLAYKERKVATRPGKNVNNAKSGGQDDPNAGLHQSEWSTKRPIVIRTVDGYAECTCENKTYSKGICLDPFGGTASTAVAAIEFGADYIMVDNKKEYASISVERLSALET